MVYLNDKLFDEVIPMQIQVHTDNHIQGSAELTQQVEAVVEDAMSRFGHRVTRVEVHLSDESSSAKARDNDKKCVMEVRLGGLQPISVSHHGMTIEQAIDGAAEKLERTIERHLGRLDAAKGRPLEE